MKDDEPVSQKKARSTPDSSYQNYLFGSAGSDENPAWSDSTKGRAAIRLVSRGIVGAAFFTIGGRMAHNQLKGYNQTTSWGNIESGKPLQYIAKSIDVTLGRGIEKTVAALASLKHGKAVAEAIGKEAITFRNSRHYVGSDFVKGRSYGADIVGFTFDFAMASIGDAGTRSIIQAFDPNVKKAWRVNDEGKPAVKGENWHFLPSEWLKSTAKTTWRVFSKNQGEDWAAAIPYAFQMKFQRQFLSNVFEKRWGGHKLVFDQGWNGGAYRVDPAAISTSNPHGIVGDMQLAGAIDLHARFVGYNWYTLMFREGYDSIGKALSDWKQNDYKINLKLPQNPILAPIEAIGQAMRYVTKSFIKANMYMNPAVVPFWLFRVPQGKWKAGTVGPEAIASQDAKRLGAGLEKPHSWSHLQQLPENTKLDVFEKRFSQMLHPFGWISNKVGCGAEHVGEKIAQSTWMPKSGMLNRFLSDNNTSLSRQENLINGTRAFMHDMTDASLSYTPYMWAKAETALRVDDNNPGKGVLGEIDLSIYKFMDDVAGFRFKEIPADLKKMWKLGTNFERSVKAREGDEPDAQQIVQAPISAKPRTLVQASSIEQAPYGKMRGMQNAHNPEYHEDKKWAQMVAGSDINAAHFHPASPTRH